MATVTQLTDWFKRGVDEQADFMIIVCDTFEYSDYPVYATAENFSDKYWGHNAVNMQKIMEVYDLRAGLELQLSKHRVHNYPLGFDPDKPPRPLVGTWRHAGGIISCGEVRVAVSGVGTSETVVLDWMCKILNAAK